MLVQALADQWGVDAPDLGRGKVVWFELERGYDVGPA